MTQRPDLRVLVIGEALIDIVQAEHRRDEHVGGSPANVALGLGRRGVPVGLLTRLADDPRGRTIVAHLEESGVHVLAESMSAPRTSTAEAMIGSDGQARYDFDLEWAAIPTPVGIAPRVVHTGSVAAFLEPGADSVRGILHSTAAKEITFDPNIRPALLGSPDVAFPAFEETARMSTVVKMSDEDAAWLYPGLSADAVLQTVLELGPRLAAITLGSKGAIIANADHRVWIPAVSVDAVDTIGAGDTFMASLVHAVLDVGSEGLDHSTLERIGRDAVRAAAITVSRAGADLPWAREL
jgi:fructokinase